MKKRRASKRRSIRTGKKQYNKRKRFSIFLILISIVLFISLGRVRFGGYIGKSFKANNIFIFVLSLISIPIFKCLGLAAYLLLFSLFFIGISQYWDFFYLTKRRNAIRALLTLPIIAVFISGLGTFIGFSSATGGFIGTYYFKYLGNAFGSILGWLIGIFAAASLAGFLWA